MWRFLFGAIVGLTPLLFAFTYPDVGSNGYVTGESVSADAMNALETSLDALEARDSIAEHESVETINVILATEIDTSAELRGILGDETGTGAAVFAGGAIGAATATTPAANDSDTSVATTAYVQGEINGAGGTDLTCASGQCNVDAGVTRDALLAATASWRERIDPPMRSRGGSPANCSALPRDQARGALVQRPLSANGGSDDGGASTR